MRKTVHTYGIGNGHDYAFSGRRYPDVMRHPESVKLVKDMIQGINGIRRGYG